MFSSDLVLIILLFNSFQIKEENGTTTYKCPRGEPECNADRVHACAIAKVTDQEKLLKFINCSMVAMSTNNTIPINEVFDFFQLIRWFFLITIGTISWNGQRWQIKVQFGLKIHGNRMLVVNSYILPNQFEFVWSCRKGFMHSISELRQNKFLHNL